MTKQKETKEKEKEFNSREIQNLLQLNNRDRYVIEKKYKDKVMTKGAWEKLLK